MKLEGWKIQPCRYLESTLGIFKYLATLETSTLLERRYKSELTAKMKGSDRISP